MTLKPTSSSERENTKPNGVVCGGGVSTQSTTIAVLGKTDGKTKKKKKKKGRGRPTESKSRLL